MTDATIGLDHLVMASKSLEELGAAYAAMGFQVGNRNQHSWGTENKIVQFPGQFLELISLSDTYASPPAHAATVPFAGFIEAYLQEREGTALFVRTTEDAAALHAEWDALGLSEPQLLHFERTGAGQDGTPTRVAFSLAFARAELSGADFGFFACQHHEPQNFWFAQRQAHPNTVRTIKRVTIVSDDVATTQKFLSVVLAPARSSTMSIDGEVEFELQGTRVVLMSQSAVSSDYRAANPSPGIASVHFAVGALDQLRHYLTTNGVAFESFGGGGVMVRAAATHGTDLVFEPDGVVGIG